MHSFLFIFSVNECYHVDMYAYIYTRSMNDVTYFFSVILILLPHLLQIVTLLYTSIPTILINCQNFPKPLPSSKRLQTFHICRHSLKFLFANDSINGAIKRLDESLLKSHYSDIKISELWSMKKSYVLLIAFVFTVSLYKQTDGLAMGNHFLLFFVISF